MSVFGPIGGPVVARFEHATNTEDLPCSSVRDDDVALAELTKSPQPRLVRSGRRWIDLRKFAKELGSRGVLTQISELVPADADIASREAVGPVGACGTRCD